MSEDRSEPMGDLVERLRKPLLQSGPLRALRDEAADAIEALTAERDRLKAERDAAREALEAANYENGSLKAIVQGWHYLAVGPDEMGDYYTHKQLVKASEPYASPALRALKDTRPRHTGEQ